MRTTPLHLALLLCLTALACADRPDFALAAELARQRDAGAELPLADVSLPVRGVADRGRDPAVVLLRSPARDCSAAFVAKDVVVTTHRCVLRLPAAELEAGMAPPTFAPAELAVHLGDAPLDEPASALGLEVVLPDLTYDPARDVAFVVLDRSLATQKPLGVRAHGVARGDRLRTVGHVAELEGFAPGARLLREHVRVRDEADWFVLDETPQARLDGAVALDPTTAQIVGLLVGSGGGGELYLRMERVSQVVDRALARSGLAKHDPNKSPQPVGAARASTQKPPSEQGGGCTRGDDCATGICIVHADRRYCSRACGTGDRCPSHHRCTALEEAPGELCVQSP